MKRFCSVLLICALLMGMLLLAGCDNAPDDVTINGNELLPNERNDTAKPGIEDAPIEDGGIGNNQPVDLPYLPV